MTAKKYVAGTLTTLLENPMVQCLLDRECDIMDALDVAVSWWDYDLTSRKPSPAYDEYGLFKGTDLDLACFLYALAGRGAIINIPTYKASGPTKMRKDQKLKSKYNRNGVLIGLGSHKQFFTFNITVIDQNVIGEDKVGDYRTFSLLGKDGQWYEGWRTIQFNPTLKENRFITENKLWSGNRIVFSHMIHENRWTSFFGQHFVITKLAIERGEEYAKFLNKEWKRINSKGIEFPEGEGPISREYEESGKGVSKQFPAFECKIYIPAAQISGDYEILEDTQDNMVWAYNTRKEIEKKLDKLRFMTRASEYAHHQNPERFPAWLKNVKWEAGFREPGKRTDWDRLKLFQAKVGEQSISILKRSFMKAAQVAA